MFGLPAWTVGAAANTVIAGCYLGISWTILRGLLQTGQLRTNRLAAATGLIFFTCAVHHGGHAMHALMPLFISDPTGLASRAGFTWQMDTWDIFGAAVAIVYLSLRSSYGRLLQTPSMFEDQVRVLAQEQIAADRAALTEAQSIARVGSWWHDLETGEQHFSDEFLRLFGLTADAARDGGQDERIHPEDRQRVAGARSRMIETGEPLDETFRVDVPGRPEAVLHARGRLERDPESGHVRATGTVQDITDRVRLEAARSAAEEQFRVAFEQAGVPMAILTLEGEAPGTFLDANLAYAEMLEVGLETLRGSDITRWIHPDDIESGHRLPLARLAEGSTGRIQFERRYFRPDGQAISAVITDAVLTAPDGSRVMIEQALDISERKRFESELRHLADHDALTGLFNRRRFEVELELAISRAHRYDTGGAVLAIDLDGFKFVNDSLGHAAGDNLVTQLAGAMRRSLRETDVVARTGGDEFAVILPQASEKEACRVAEKLLSVIRRNGVVQYGERRGQVTGSIGVTLFGLGSEAEADTEVTGADLMIEADMAMYDAKAAGKDRVSVHRRDQRQRQRLNARQDWLSRLRSVAEQERFVLWAQPIVPVCTSGVPSYELLLRMPDGRGDLIGPSAFLYNAERFGLIEQIDEWVLRQAVTMIGTYRAVGAEVSLSVNMSPKTLAAGRVPELLPRLLEAHDVPPGRLVLEITETAAISNMDLAVDLARDVRSLGVRVAIDDFGAGFATFYYLKHLDFDFVKIDGEFVRHLPDSRADQLVVKSVVEIAKGLGAQTIAEFVQDDATLELLREFGVDYAQGFHTGRPGPVEKILPEVRTVR